VTADITPWTSLVTSEFSEKPKFMATLAVGLQPLAEMRDLLLSLPSAFDVDNAVGAQLDAVGLWVGVTRTLPNEISGVYFSFDTDGLGWDEGTWWAPGDPATTLISLPDDAFRTFIKVRISSNHWDGTTSGIYAAWDALLASTGLSVLVEDTQDMAMNQVLIGGTPDVITSILFEGGYFDLTPAGVLVNSVVGSYPPSAPILFSTAAFGEATFGEI
jgi:hypothetical protein